MNKLFDTELFKRKGTFFIVTDTLKEDELPAVLEAFSKVFICKCSSDFVNGRLNYSGYSEEFELTPDFSLAPEYKLIFENRGDLGIHFSRFEKA
jgi:hypothetical protein